MEKVTGRKELNKRSDDGRKALRKGKRVKRRKKERGSGKARGILLRGKERKNEKNIRR